MLQYVFIAIRKVLVAFVSAVILPYITIFVTKVLSEEPSRLLLGEVMQYFPSLVILMAFVAVGSYVIELIWGKKRIQVPFLFLGVHGIYVSIVMFFYIQGWVYLIVGFIMGIIYVIFDRIFNYWARMMMYYEENSKK